jgi:hypothetical protein
MTVMWKKNLLLLVLLCAVAAAFAAQVRGEAGEEVRRLAELMEGGDGSCGHWGGRWEAHVCGGGTRGGSRESVCDGD